MHFYVGSTSASFIFDGRKYTDPPTLVVRLITAGKTWWATNRLALEDVDQSGVPRNGMPQSNTDPILIIPKFSDQLWMRGNIDPSIEVSVELVSSVDPSAAAVRELTALLKQGISSAPRSLWARLFGRKPAPATGNGASPKLLTAAPDQPVDPASPLYRNWSPLGLILAMLLSSAFAFAQGPPKIVRAEAGTPVYLEKNQSVAQNSTYQFSLPVLPATIIFAVDSDGVTTFTGTLTVRGAGYSNPNLAGSSRQNITCYNQNVFLGATGSGTNLAGQSVVLDSSIVTRSFMICPGVITPNIQMFVTSSSITGSGAYSLWTWIIPEALGKPVGVIFNSTQSASELPPAFEASAILDGLTGTTTTEIVPASAGNQIRIGSMFTTNSSATGENVRLVAGTGTNCATGQTNVTSNINVPGAAGSDNATTDFIFPGAGLKAPSGAAVCVKVSGTGNVGVTITYSQF